VTATDGDKDREHNIVYFLTGQGIDADNPAQSKFDINRTSGEIYVLKVSNSYCPSIWGIVRFDPTLEYSCQKLRYVQFVDNE
jgi:hypothetical protein